MSRCFPFPPPGYAGKCSTNDALILSIKLQRENEKVNSDREREKKSKSLDKKERKREKKERKKLKEKSNHAVDGVKEKLVEKLYQIDNFKAASKDKSGLQLQSSLLEKSNVTEEHGQPVDLQKASCSSDSTGNSGKRRRPLTPPNSIQSHGNIIRIRLASSHRTEEPSTSGRKDKGICLPLQRRQDPSRSYHNIQPCSDLLWEDKSSTKLENVDLSQHSLIISSTSSAKVQLAAKQDQKVLGLSDNKIGLAPLKEELSSHDKKMLKKESQYKNLFECWAPHMLQSELVMDEGDDEDWLFGSKGEEKAAKRLKTSDDSLVRCASAVMQPRAIYLPDAEIYALPFTVPF